MQGLKLLLLISLAIIIEGNEHEDTYVQDYEVLSGHLCDDKKSPTEEALDKAVKCEKNPPKSAQKIYKKCLPKANDLKKLQKKKESHNRLMKIWCSEKFEECLFDESHKLSIKEEDALFDWEDEFIHCVDKILYP